MSDKKILKPKSAAMADHVAIGATLFPCRAPGTMIRDKKDKLVSGAKLPKAGLKWRESRKSPRKVVARYGDAVNIAWALSDSDLVVDFDPRNGSDESKEKWLADLALEGIEFDESELVRYCTPSGGEHWVFKKDAAVRVQRKHPRYPGMEFISAGGYVLIAGSSNGERRYKLAEGSLPLTKRPEAPVGMLKLVERSTAAPDARGEPGDLTNEQLAKALAGIDPEKFACRGSYEDWLRILAAAHFASAGDGIDEAAEWSARSQDFGDDGAEDARAKWDTFGLDREAAVGIGTLGHYIKESGNAVSDFLPIQKADPQEDFDDDLDAPTPEADGGGGDQDFKRGENGRPQPTQENLKLALRKLGVTVKHDQFSSRNLIDGLKGFGPYLDDAAVNHLRLRIDRKWQFLAPKEFFFDVILDLAQRNAFHPVRDYLAALTWDGTPRLDTWLHDYGGAPDTEYTRAVGALMLIAAVRRVRRPGVKFDEMAVFESAQGTNKSSALTILAVKPEWFSDNLPLNADDKRVIEVLTGKWIVEAGELKGMRKGEIEHVKALLSRPIDRARLAYDRMPVERPRQCVFFGTTNAHQYLRDPSGNRRFWPVKIKVFDLKALKRDRDQLWAEAAAREADGESIRLASDMWSAAEAEQEKRTVADPYIDKLADVLGDMPGAIRSEDLWAILNVNAGNRTQEHNARFGHAMAVLGWRKPNRGGTLRFNGQKRHCYVRGEKPFRKIEIVSDGGNLVPEYAESTSEDISS
jgi:hypothetical protein